MNIVTWIPGIVFVGVAWVLNIVTRARLDSGDIDKAKSSQRYATTFTSFGFGWFIGQVINYFLK